MNNRWPLAKLVNVMKYRKEFITIDNSTIYRRVTAKLQAKGVVFRDEIEGSFLKTKKQQVCKAGDFLVAEIDAKVGGFGIVPDELAGAIVSSHYFLFEINEEKLEKKYLEYFIKTQDFQKQIRARGSTNYAAIRPEQVLDLEIPLPLLSEQKSIVVKIEVLIKRIDEASRHRRETLEEVEKLLSAVYYKSFSDTSLMKIKKKIDEICTKPQYGYTDSAKYEPVGPKFLRITDIQNGKVNWSEVPYSICPTKQKYILRPGDILFARSGATTGKSYLVGSSPESIFASYLIRIRPKEGVLPEYLYEFFQSPIYWSQVIEETKGSALPNMNGKKLSNIEVPLPESEETQLQIVDQITRYRSKIDEMKRLQAETEKEIDKLIPSILERFLKGEL